MLKIKNIEINYIDYGQEDGNTVVLLHGWGQNIEMMKMLGDALCGGFRIVILDFPGFGDSEEPKEPWTLNDYVDMLDEFLDKLKIKNPILIGHSFGGRVALMYSGMKENKPKKLILCASPFKAGIQKQTLKLKVMRICKKIPGAKKLENFVKKRVGSRDYRNATPVMRATLVNILKEDLSEYARKITCPAILIWGTLDEEATIEEGRELEGLLTDGALIAYEGLGHYAYLENLGQTNSIINNFLESDRCN